MSAENEPFVLTICGQEFRLRVADEDRARVREIGATVDAMIRERKGRAMQSDLRAAIMTAYELADELREVRQELERLKSSNAATRMDELLEKLDREIGPGEPGPSTGRKNQGPKG